MRRCSTVTNPTLDPEGGLGGLPDGGPEAAFGFSPVSLDARLDPGEGAAGVGTLTLLRHVLRFTLVLAALALPGQALAGGGNYVFDGGSAKERSTVRGALEASLFDWGLVPGPVTIHVARVGTSYATPGHIWLDAGLLASGRFAWGIVQHEYAHQVDFLLHGADARRQLQSRLGGRAYCGEIPGTAHGDNTCERFASTLAWTYWPSTDNALRPSSASDEAAAMAPATFRALLATLVGPPAAVGNTVVRASAPRPLR